MKKVLGLGLLCVLVGCSEPHDPTGGGKLAITKHENGATASRGYVITNAVSDEPIKVGDWVYHYEDGQKEKQGSYLEDQMEGVWIEWDTFGCKFEGTYKNGEREGVWTAWHPNGQKMAEVTYKNNKMDGVCINWYENGQKWEEGTLKNGKQEGVVTAWHENGQKDREGTWKNDKKDGVWTYWDDKGNVTKTETYKNGELVK